jgi:hypothetical protein
VTVIERHATEVDSEEFVVEDSSVLTSTDEFECDLEFVSEDNPLGAIQFVISDDGFGLFEE